MPDGVGRSDDPVTIRWWNRRPRLEAVVDATLSLGFVLYAIYTYSVHTGFLRWLAVGIGLVFGFSLTARIARYALRLHESEVARITAETAAEKHPDGCMCPFCVQVRVENDEEVNPHA